VAARHQLTPILESALRDSLAADPATAATLRRERYYTARRQAQLALLAGPFLDALRARAIPVIVLKGGILADRDYLTPEDRPMQDVDLLVRPGDVDKALAAAGDVGLQRFDDAHTLDFDLGFDATTVLTRHPHDLRQPSLDLHWGVLRDWIGTRGDGWLVTAWERAEPASYAGRAVLTLAPADQFVHLALHLAIHHTFDGLLWFCDLALMIRNHGQRIDWGDVVTGARRLGFGGALTLILELLDELFGVRPPDGVLRRLAPRSWRHALARRLVRSRVLRLQPLSHLEYLIPLLLMDSSRKALGTVWRRVVPSQRWLELRYPETRWPLHYVRHGLATARFAVRTVRGR